MTLTQRSDLLSYTEIQRSATVENNQHIGMLGDIVVRSGFQPIYSLLHAKIVGAEGLMRCTSGNGKPISPLDMLAQASTDLRSSVHLDRLCRYLHVNNAVRLLPDPCWLFLNVNPSVVISGSSYGPFFRELLEASNFPAHRVVVEILEDSTSEESQLHKAIDYFRELGCVIAIDDFGTGHSNFNRVWEINPDIVKLDRSLVVRSSTDYRTRRTLPNLVDMLHESGCHVLMEGIETEQEAVTAVRAGVDMVQGYYFARPNLELKPQEDIPEKVQHIYHQYVQSTRDKAYTTAYTLKEYVEVFRTVLDGLHMNALDAVIAQLLSLSYVIRCYILSEQGKQICTSMLPINTESGDPRFAVLANGEGADWSTRKYFRNALQNIGQVQISEQYFSIPDGKMCVTLSVAGQHGSEIQVLCCDLKVD